MANVRLAAVILSIGRCPSWLHLAIGLHFLGSPLPILPISVGVGIGIGFESREASQQRSLRDTHTVSCARTSQRSVDSDSDSAPTPI